MVKHHQKIRTCVFVVFGLFALSGFPRSGPIADLVLKNGVFFTVNQEKPLVEAIAIKGEYVLAVGTNGEIQRFVNKHTEIINVDGNFGCPGFNDAHLHFLSGGLSMGEVDLMGVMSISEIQRRIREKAKTLPPDTWLVGRGWDQSILPGKQWPDRKILDMAVSEIPVFIKRVCGHTAVVNSKALRIAGIDKNTPNPAAGEIVKNPKTGIPTGILHEEAMSLINQYIPSPSRQTIRQAIEMALEKACRLGITSIQDYSEKEVVDIYHALEKEHQLTSRVSLWYSLQDNREEYTKAYRKQQGNMVRLGLLKGFIDGSMGARTAAFFNPYLDDPTTCGMPQMSQEKLNQLVLAADKEGFQLGIHAIGDRGNRMVLDAYALARETNGSDIRHRIEHVQVLDKGDLARFHKLGIVASMQPVHCIEDKRWAEQRIGSNRCRYAYAWRSLKDHGAVMAFGTDWPVSPMNPMIGLYAAITRQDTSGFPPEGWFPQERLTVEEAIEAYTLGSAFAQYLENEKGTLEPGKLADIVILDQNLLNISPQDILKTEVIYTFLGGRTVYQRNQ